MSLDQNIVERIREFVHAERKGWQRRLHNELTKIAQHLTDRGLYVSSERITHAATACRKSLEDRCNFIVSTIKRVCEAHHTRFSDSLSEDLLNLFNEVRAEDLAEVRATFDKATSDVRRALQIHHIEPRIETDKHTAELRLFVDQLKCSAEPLQQPPIRDARTTAYRAKHVFISYSRKDKEWLDRLRTHLKPFENTARIDVWDDSRIETGTKWKDEIEKALALASVAVLLVSPNFLASDFITQVELPALWKAAQQNRLTIVWVPLSSSAVAETDIVQYQAAIDPNQPLDGMTEPEQNRALVEICAKIKAAYIRSTNGSFQQLADALAAKGRESTVLELLDAECAVPDHLQFLASDNSEDRLAKMLSLADDSYESANKLSAAEIHDHDRLKELVIDSAIMTLIAITGCVTGSIARKDELQLARNLLHVILGSFGFTAPHDDAVDLNGLFLAARETNEEELGRIKRLLLQDVR